MAVAIDCSFSEERATCPGQDGGLGRGAASQHVSCNLSLAWAGTALLCFQPLNEQGFHRAACVPAQLSARPCVIGPAPGEEARTSRIQSPSLPLWSSNTGPESPDAPPTLSRGSKGSLRPLSRMCSVASGSFSLSSPSVK